MDRVELKMRSEGGHLHVPGRDGATPGAGIAIGVSHYGDSRLTSCPAAARTAEAVAQALGPLLSNGVTAVVDPKQSYELFLVLQKAIEKARGGLFVLYFAGITFRRGDDLLLTTCGSALEAKSDCVPWWDVDSILEQAKIEQGLVVLNTEGFAGVGWGGAKASNVHGMGSVRIHDPLTAEKRIGEYGDALTDALQKGGHELRSHLSDGRLDIAALGRYLTARFPTPEGADPMRPPKRGEGPRHETYGTPDGSSAVLRDLRDELSRPASSALSLGASTTPSGSRRGLAVLVALGVAAAVAGTVFFLLFR